MKVLMFSTDSSILTSGTPAQQRMIEYGSLVERLFIVVLSKKRSNNQILDISRNVRVYPSWFWSAWNLGKMFKEQNIDLVTAQDPFEIGLVGYLTARRLKAKLQLQIHTDFLNQYFIKESLKNRIRVSLAKRLLLKANSIRVVSQRIKDSLSNVKCQMSNVFVLPIFVDAVKIQLELITVDLHAKYPQFDFILLMTSRFEREKNIELAIHAMQEIVKKYSKTGLVIVGSGSLEGELKRQVRELNLGDNIKFEDWISDFEKYISYYRTSDAYLLCSNYEGYGLVLIMAASAGLPIITTDVGVAGEMKIKDSGLVVGVRDKQAIVDKIIALRSNDNLRKGLRLRAKEFVKEQKLKTKEEYLKKYKESWEMAL